MRLTVVGCSGSYPGPDSPASCYLLEQEHLGRTWRLVLDLGNGALGALHRYADPLTIDAVLLSHLHADHCIDLTSYYVLRKYHPAGSSPPIPVYGPDGTPGRLARAYDLPKSPGMTEEFTFHHYPDATVTIGPFAVRAVEVKHPVPAYALRISAGGRTLAYSGDTGVCAGVREAAAHSNLFLCEASFVEGEDNPPDLHLTGAEAGRIGTDAGVDRLVLTHVPPWHDAGVMLAEAKGTYAGPLELAAPGRSYEI
ncbi:MBL fold metallo-hydrolase [Nocardioides terrisoli]|uniref:MBL fold metallo-hydrolase n=1 Tax=Nocardioides terrisoli TaxID=3388267 RepID=UPI00287BB70D|nr:MBL fold metallo-hydrolase [Nocardioides marmorisolisilvae]